MGCILFIMTKKDYIYNGVYLTLLIGFYFFNVYLFDHQFKKYEWCDFYFENARKGLSGEPIKEPLIRK